MLRASREKVVANAEKLISRGKIESGIKEYRKLLSDNPNDISTLNRVGDLYARINRNSEAIELFKRIAERYAEDGFLVKAIAIYKKIIKLDPTLLEIYEQLADLYHRQGLVNEARTQYQVLADYYQKHDKPASALKVHERMVELEPDNPTHHAKLAELYQRDGMTSAALGEYRAIAELMLEHGRGEEAAQVYERGLAVTSEDIGFITDGVLKLKEGGHVAAAARFLSLAVERNPKAEQVARVAGLGAADEGSTEVKAEAPAAEEAAEADASAVSLSEEGDEQTASTLGRGTAPALDAAEAIDLAPPAESVDSIGSIEPEAPGPAAEAGSAGGTGQLDLGEAEDAPDLSELELEGFDTEDPDSLVQPPADMLEDRERRGAAWEEGGTGTGTGTWTGARAEAEPGPPEGSTGTFEFELDLEAEDDDLLDLTPKPQPAEAYEAGPYEAEGYEAIEPAEAEQGEMVDLQQPEPSSVGLDHDLLERTAAEVHEQETGGPDDLFTEAEVLVRYGIEAKALERLAELLQRHPRHLEGYQLMVTLHLEGGRHGRAAAVAGRMAEVADEVGDDEIWPEMRARLEEEGYQLSGFVVTPPAGFEVEAEAEVPEPAAEEFAVEEPEPEAEPEAAESSDGVVFSLSDDEAEAEGIEVELDEDRFELPEVAPPDEVAPEAPLEAAEEAPSRRGRGSGDVDAALAELSAEFVDSRPKRKRPQPEAPVEEAPPEPVEEAPAEPVEEPIAVEEAVVAEEAMAADEPLMEAAAAAVQESEGGGVDPLLALGDSLREEIDLGEDDEQGARIAAASPPAVSEKAPEPAPAKSGIGWLDEVSAPAGDGALFAAEDDFFDLGAELEQELSADGSLHAGEDLLVSSTEQSLEDIVEGFKKGVAENLSSEDFDTHFNLGIAYREMGLLDEAIGEFQLAAKGPGYLISCASMLGLCFQEKGMPELAVKWYQRGLDAEGIPEEDHLGLLYDLGNAQAAAGDSDAAYSTFVDLYGINTNYRDVVARLAELEPGRAE